jgi:hypothetical protein
MMNNNIINFNNNLYQVKRSFKIDSWFIKAIEQFGAEEVCNAYHIDKIIRDSNGTHYLVNEIKDAEIISES